IPGSKELIQKILKKSSAYTGATGLALPLAAAGISSIQHLISNPGLITGIQEKSLKLKKRFIDIGFDMPMSPSPVFSVTFYNEEKNLVLRRKLLDNGIYPPFINYPGAPRGGHFRFIITSETSEDQINLLFETVKSAI
ncbi:MAG: aminotransferase class I/II-fold pyridoxal phosphate-dependent enzyme, partial [Bacteroidota bacterium]